MKSNTDLVDSIVERLKEEGLLTDETEAKECLMSMLGDRIGIYWYVSDVRGALAYKYGNDAISVEDTKKVLQCLAEEHNTHVGITWNNVRLKAEALAREGIVTIKGYQPD